MSRAERAAGLEKVQTLVLEAHLRLGNDLTGRLQKLVGITWRCHSLVTLFRAAQQNAVGTRTCAQEKLNARTRKLVAALPGQVRGGMFAAWV